MTERTATSPAGGGEGRGEDGSESIPISLVAHHAFCPRRAWLEAAGEKQDSSFAMAVGDSAHARVDDASASERTTLRGMDIRSREHGFHGRLDLAEVMHDGSLRIVEYKATPERRASTTTEPMRRQVALQRLALEEMGRTVSGADVYFATQRRRVPVDLDEETTRAALAEVASTRDLLESEVAPPPLEDDPRCAGCSHVSLCLPDERREETTTRRIAVADPDGQVLHLATYGAHASIRSGRVRVRKSGEELSSVPVERVHAVVVHGNVDLSSGLQRELMWRRVPIIWCSSGGRVVGWAASAHSPNGSGRVRQHVASAEGRIALAREFIGAKIHNQATQLRRHGGDADDVSALRQLARDSAKASDVPRLFGVEGTAARIYFSGLPSMLSDSAEEFGATFPGRVGRGATDRLNVCLNYAYALLTGDCIRGLLACGLDPHAGFLHSSTRNKPALALDLMEEFRSPVAESAVLGAINNGEIKTGDFWQVDGSFRMKDPARKALIAAYERRASTEFTHPVFGYRVSWRRAIEVQARMVLGVLDGTQDRYAGVRVR